MWFYLVKCYLLSTFLDEFEKAGDKNWLQKAGKYESNTKTEDKPENHREQIRNRVKT